LSDERLVLAGEADKGVALATLGHNIGFGHMLKHQVLKAYTYLDI
jgi:hypothetical protein